jgi:hypothetical protein
VWNKNSLNAWLRRKHLSEALESFLTFFVTRDMLREIKICGFILVTKAPFYYELNSA